MPMMEVENMGVNITYTVYIHIDPDGKRYVGMTKRNAKDRWNNGFGYATNKDQRFFDAIRTIGWDNFAHEIVATNLTKEEAQSMEAELIKKYQTTNPKYGYNIVDGRRNRRSEGKQWTGTIRATTDLVNQLQDIANNECRTLNNLIVYVLTKYVNQYNGEEDDDADIEIN